MSEEPAVHCETVVAATPATAFRLFTDEIDRWWRRGPRFRWNPARGGTLRFEPGTGGRLVEVAPGDAGDVFEVGRVLAWDPPDGLRFAFRRRDFAPDETTEVEVRFEPVTEGTRVRLWHRGLEAVRERAIADVVSVWWADLLVSLRQHAAGEGAS